jgi:hypothetical protein
MTWTPVAAQGSGTWSSLAGGADDWVDIRLTLLLTEAGVGLHAETERFLVTEAVRVLSSATWTPA